jgi:hypothetical protein
MILLYFYFFITSSAYIDFYYQQVLIEGTFILNHSGNATICIYSVNGSILLDGILCKECCKISKLNSSFIIVSLIPSSFIYILADSYMSNNEFIILMSISGSIVALTLFSAYIVYKYSLIPVQKIHISESI